MNSNSILAQTFLIMGADFMRKSYEQNRALLGDKKSLKELNTAYSSIKRSKRKGLKFKKSNPRSLAILRKKLVDDNISNDILRIGIFVALVFIIGYFVYRLFFVAELTI